MEHAPRLDRTALIVDDDVFMVAALAELLDDEGFDVHTASNGFSALRLAGELRPALMLLDLMLPERSGHQLIQDLRADAATRHMAIVVVTGHADGLSEEQLAETDGLVLKPFDTGELLATVHRAVLRAANHRGEVAPVAAPSHVAASARGRRVAGPRRSRGRR